MQLFEFWNARNANIEVLFSIQTLFSPTQVQIDMEGKCINVKEWPKYKCLECFTFVCKICLKFRDHGIYNEEEKLIGKCKNCNGNQVALKWKSDNKH